MPARLAGRILLQVQSRGEAYYVDPLTSELHYLGQPQDAFNLMRRLGLGISEVDLAKIPRFIPLSAKQPLSERTGVYRFKYGNSPYEISLGLSSSLYESYLMSPKSYTYSSANPPTNVRDAFYGLFFTRKTADTSLDDLAGQLQELAAAKQWSSDQLADFSLALIQFMPYDSDKVSASNFNSNPYYPYETLYLNKGVCSDKTFLAVALLRRLGFGAAILDFPESNHSAVGITCPLADSISSSGYCYGETTNYFPIGVVPASLASGQAQVESAFNPLFSAESLGRLEIYQATTGKQYGQVPATKKLAQDISAQQAQIAIDKQSLLDQEGKYQQQGAEITAKREQLDSYLASGQISAYNSLVSEYNALVKNYNSGLSELQAAAAAYNAAVDGFNQAVRDFYQK